MSKRKPSRWLSKRSGSTKALSLIISIMLSGVFNVAIAVAATLEEEVGATISTSSDAPTTIKQGESKTFTIYLSATGNLDPSFTASSPATTTVQTSYSLQKLGDGTVVTNKSGPTRRAFWANPSSGSGKAVTWVGAPSPYAISATVSVAADVPEGPYSFQIDSGGTGLTGLSLKPDGTPHTVYIKVETGDVTPPTGNLTINNDDAYTNNPDVSLRLNASDPSNVTAYRLAEGSDASGASLTAVSPATEVSPTVPFTLTGGDGVRTVAVQYRDAFGNWSGNFTDDIFLDTVKPGVTANVYPAPNAAGWHKDNVDVGFSADDPAPSSGINAVDGTQTITSEGTTVVTGKAADNAGNEGEASATVKIDKTAPTISGSRTPAANSDGWNNTDVTVSFSGNDTLSGLNSITPDTVVSAEGAGQSVTGTAVDNADNSASVAVGDINIDKTKPTVSITGVADGAAYTLGSVPAAGYSATDDLSGVKTDSASLTGGNSNGVGTFTYSVQATDKAGNTESTLVTYHVVYPWSGILQPINADGSSIFKLGSTVPVKFALSVGGSAFGDATATLSLAKVTDSIEGSVAEATSTSAATTGNAFRYDPTGRQYIFNLATKGLTAGTYSLKITLDDGWTRTVTISLKK